MTIPKMPLSIRDEDFFVFGVVFHRVIEIYDFAMLLFKSQLGMNCRLYTRQHAK